MQNRNRLILKLISWMKAQHQHKYLHPKMKNNWHIDDTTLYCYGSNTLYQKTLMAHLLKHYATLLLGDIIMSLKAIWTLAFGY